jgi:hypothetical protein
MPKDIYNIFENSQIRRLAVIQKCLYHLFVYPYVYRSPLIHKALRRRLGPNITTRQPAKSNCFLLRSVTRE